MLTIGEGSRGRRTTARGRCQKAQEPPVLGVSKIDLGERRLDVVEFVELAAAIEVDAVRILRQVIEETQKA